MAFTVCDIGMGMGKFPSLRLAHLIPRQRVTDDYLIRLIEGIAYSDTILTALRDGIPVQPCRVDRLVDRYKRFRMPRIERSIARAVANERSRALNYLAGSKNVSVR